MQAFPKLSYVCPIPWAELRGNDRARYCEKCGLNVTDLSRLDADARAAFLARADTERLCVSFYRRLNGEYVTPENPLTSDERPKIRQLGVAALSASALALAAGCVSGPASLPPPVGNEPPRAAADSPATVTPDEDVVVLQAFGMICIPPPADRKRDSR